MTTSLFTTGLPGTARRSVFRQRLPAVTVSSEVLLPGLPGTGIYPKGRIPLRSPTRPTLY